MEFQGNSVTSRRKRVHLLVHYTTTYIMATTSSKRGAFIVLEGLDRSGKSTQVDRLIARLNDGGHKARLQKFPGMLGLCLCFCFPSLKECKWDMEGNGRRLMKDVLRSRDYNEIADKCL